MENILKKEIQDDGKFGAIDVQLSPVGSFNGSDAKGQPVPENLTQESLEKLAETLNSSGDEVLVDIDHQSCKPGPEKNTRAVGWLSKFYANVKGLFARLSFTKKGRELVEERAYRNLSPVFALNAAGEPVDLHSVAFTNTPALPNENILNSKPNGDILNMTKEELVELIKETITVMNSAPTEPVKETEVVNSEPEKPVEEKPVEEEKPAEEKPVEESKADIVEETPAAEVENSCDKEEKKEEMKNEEPVAEEPVAEEPKKDEPVKKEPEVIKVEALNSMPAASQYDVVDNVPAWKNMHGKEFFNWLQKHPKGI